MIIFSRLTKSFDDKYLTAEVNLVKRILSSGILLLISCFKTLDLVSPSLNRSCRLTERSYEAPLNLIFSGSVTELRFAIVFPSSPSSNGFPGLTNTLLKFYGFNLLETLDS